MNRKRTSVVWGISDEEFIDRVKTSATMTDLLKTFNLKNRGSNFKTCKARIKKLSLDTSHFLSRLAASNRSNENTKDDVLLKLTINSIINNSFLKKQLLKFNLIDRKCKECDITDTWNNKPIVLQLEHINGISNDNRLDNLCLLCPNCHSQTATYAGKNVKRALLVMNKCNDCGVSITDNALKCEICSHFKRRKAERPSEEDLKEMIKIMPLEKIAKKFNLKTGNTIKKWCKSYGFDSKDISPYSHK